MATIQERLSEVDKEIALLIRARFPIISILTHEEWRVLRQLERVRAELLAARASERARVQHPAAPQEAAAAPPSDAQLYPILRWTVTDGLVLWSNEEDDDPYVDLGYDTRNPVELLTRLRLESDRAVYTKSRKTEIDLNTALVVFCDLHVWLDREDRASRFNHVLVRALRDLAYLFKTRVDPGAVILLSPRSVVPLELDKEIQIIDYPLPTVDQLENRFTRRWDELKLRFGESSIKLSSSEKKGLMQALCGLTFDEADSVIEKSLANNGILEGSDLQEALREKRQIIRKDGMLEYFDNDTAMDKVGGLELLREWLERRRRAFEGGYVEVDNVRIPLPIPKGMLLIGVPGGGKSLVAKAVARTWGLPLLRLDVGRIFGGTVGQSEENMRRAIRIAKSVAPAILWLDEVEKAFPRTTGAGDSGTSLRVMNTFLTWLQEKKEPVFVVATGNDIQQVPPELTRKGRFDEIFYVGLPDEQARRDILTIHTRAFPLTGPDLDTLVVRSKYFTGAEIEQCINDALYLIPTITGPKASGPQPGEPTLPLPLAIYTAMGNLVPLARREQGGGLVLAETLRRAKTLAVPASARFEELPTSGPESAAPPRPVWNRGRPASRP